MGLLNHSAAARWHREPFRIFFPLGVLFAWIGIGHWLLYATGVTQTYSCLFHGLLQMQAFMMAFAVGFLLTAVPRRTQSAPPSTLELTAAVLALVTTAAAAISERWRLAEAAYAIVFVLLLQFAVRRFLGQRAGRRPPAAFVLIPMGVLHGLGGAALIAASTAPHAPAWTMALGRLLVEQGVFLCFAVGVGGLVLPLMDGAPPPPDLGSSRRETRTALAYAATGVLIFTSFLLEQWGWVRGGPLLRAAMVVVGFTLGGSAWHRPATPGVHRQLVWLAVWLMPVGLLISALWPDYRVPALHILFIGGFGLMAFAVATHVALSHLNLEAAALGRPPAVIVLGAAFLLSMFARLAADFSDSYFDHLAWAAAIWLTGSAVWLAFLGPKLLRR
jgi:uncharacterized protein involved in response to NO